VSDLPLRMSSSLSAQGARFAISGCLVSAVYLLATTVLAVLARLPFEVALAIGYLTAISLHFCLQRMFVWAHHKEFALPLRGQLGRYLLLAGAQYGVTAASTSLLPSWLGLPTEIVYLATALAITLVNFAVFRNGIFHGKRRVGDSRPASGASLSPAPHGLEV
jgi:putative flippase GtrA